MNSYNNIINYDKLFTITSLIFITFAIIYLNIENFYYNNVFAQVETNKNIMISDTYEYNNNKKIDTYNIQFKIDKSEFEKAPEFTQIAGYLNTDPITIADLKGKIVLVHFWTYTCINCIHTVPYLNEWYKNYSDKGLVIVGIHTPEFDFEKNLDNVKQAVKEYKIEYPVLQDNNYATWNAYENRYWPRDYVVDTEGYIRYNHIGEGGYTNTENVIKSLLSESKSQKLLKLDKIVNN